MPSAGALLVVGSMLVYIVRYVVGIPLSSFLYSTYTAVPLVPTATPTLILSVSDSPDSILGIIFFSISLTRAKHFSCVIAVVALLV